MSKILPLGITRIDWRNYDRLSRTYLDSSPIDYLNNKEIKLDKPESFLKTLPDHNEGHIQILFVILDILPDMFLQSNIEVTRLEDKVYLISANLRVLKNLIIEYLVKDSRVQDRKILSNLLTILESNFAYLFSNYKKEKQLDGTYVLQ